MLLSRIKQKEYSPLLHFSLFLKLLHLIPCSDTFTLLNLFFSFLLFKNFQQTETMLHLWVKQMHFFHKRANLVCQPWPEKGVATRSLGIGVYLIYQANFLMFSCQNWKENILLEMNSQKWIQYRQLHNLLYFWYHLHNCGD